MIVERCRANGCTVTHPSDGSIQLFEYETTVRCKQCGETTSRQTEESLEERTHRCDVCKEPLDVFGDAVRLSVSHSASTSDRVEIEVHPRCAVNAPIALMTKYTREMEPNLRGGRKPRWWDSLRQKLGLSTEPTEEEK